MPRKHKNRRHFHGQTASVLPTRSVNCVRCRKKYKQTGNLLCSPPSYSIISDGVYKNSDVDFIIAVAVFTINVGDYRIDAVVKKFISGRQEKTNIGCEKSVLHSTERPHEAINFF